MHCALFLDEILSAIFGHCYPCALFRISGSRSDLVALAATCQAFKEPALDVLWSELNNPTPLLRCLPRVCCLNINLDSGDRTYMFKRQLDDSERAAVKRYTRRIRSLTICFDGFRLDPQSLADLLPPSPTDPFFPNLRRLEFFVTEQTVPLIHHIAGPKLRWLHLYSSVDTAYFETFCYSLGSSCPNMESMEIAYTSGRCSVEFDHIMTQQIRCWNHLRTLSWSQVTLDIDSLAHLSRMPGLSKLSFVLPLASMKQTSPNTPLVFPTLNDLQVYAESITAAPKLLARVLLPAITRVFIFLGTTPSGYAIKSFSMALARTCDSLSVLHVGQISLSPLVAFDNPEHFLTLDDIRPLMAFKFTQICIDVNCVIDLSDSSLLEFVSSCHQLVTLTINKSFGWRTPGTTPAGLAQILHNCRSLSSLSIALDTRDPSFFVQRGKNSYRSIFPLNVDVLDSVIEEESIPALAAFFADQVLGRAAGISLSSCDSYFICHRVPDAALYKARWKEVHYLVNEIVQECRPSAPGSVSF